MSKYRCSILVIIAVFVVSTILTGCRDNNELDTISIVTGVGIDAAEKEEDIRMVLQVGRIKEDSGYEGGNTQQESSSLIMETEDKGVLSAINNLETQTTRTLFLDHSQAIVFGKEQVKKGIKEYMDAFIRSRQMRLETWVIVADNTAKDILSASLEQETNSAIGLSKMIESSSQEYKSFAVKLVDLTSKMMEESTSPVIPIVQLKNEDESSEFDIVGLAILKDGKYIGELDLEKVRGYSWVMDHCIKNSLDVTVEQGYANMYVSNIRLRKDPKMEGDELSISIDFRGDIEVSEIQGFQGMNASEVFSIFKKASEEAVKKEVLDCFNYTKGLNADIYGFGTDISRKYPKEWETIKEDWNDVYTALEMDINVNLNVIETGKIIKSLDMVEGSE